jgi:transglutaminase-like putative cysteine protease
MGRTFDIDCELNYDVHAPSTFVFKIEAAFTPEQSIGHESLTTLPPGLPVDRYIDHLATRTLRITVPPGDFSIRYLTRAVVDRPHAHASAQEIALADLPLDTLPFLSGSRYIESELIFQDALGWIGAHARGQQRVERICQWVRDNVKYEIGTSLPFGTARDVLASRTGVCRDYAHVSIALCRALGIPARLVVGHVWWDTPPPDFHALFEAFLDGRWMLFDPTQMADTSDVIRIGTGFDAADVPFATIFGAATMTRMSPLVFGVR